MSIRPVLAALVIIGLGSVPASAADPVKVAPTPAVMFSWAGFYLGASVGGAWASVDNSYALDTSPGTIHLQPALKGSALLFGVQGGRNWQSNNFVWGIEQDAIFVGIDGNDHNLSGAIDTFSSKYMGSYRARLGVAANTVLFYATGGVAVLNYDYSLTGTSTQTENVHALGWTAGGGIEIALGKRVSVRGEYRYSDFLTQKVHFAGGGGSNISPQTIRVHPVIQAVTVGLNFRL